MQKIGIWGLGVGGMSVIRYLSEKGYVLGAYDKRPLSDSEKDLLQKHNVTLFEPLDLESFLQSHEKIVPSAGIDLRPYTPYADKWMSEVDLFAEAHKNRLVAITGTLGKTTVTHLITHLINSAGYTALSGGNIGVGMLDLAEMTKDYTVLELSSFQLDITKRVAPDLAIVTNIYPNHLDRHGTMNEYVNAKYKLLEHQNKNQKALVHADLYHLIKARNPQAELRVFSEAKPAFECDHSYYFEDDRTIIVDHKTSIRKMVVDLPASSYRLNWLTVIAALDTLEINIPDLKTVSFTVPAHRLDHIASIDGIDFYDDSKSTVPQATMAAVSKLNTRPIVILIGGIGKGVDREPLIKSLAHLVKKAYFFGIEGAQLHEYANRYNLSSSVHPTLDDAFIAATNAVEVNDQILLSPAGASYDLYKNYKDRGNAFRQLVMEYQKRKSTANS